MEEVRCPMCSKPNPKDAEVCEFCGARIKPLIIHQEPEDVSQPEPKEPPTPREQPEDKPRAETDWLGRMRYGVSAEEEEQELEEDLSGPKRGETDLLGRFRDLGISDDSSETLEDEIPFEAEPELEVREEPSDVESPLDLGERLSVPDADTELEKRLSFPDQEPRLEIDHPEPESETDREFGGFDEKPFKSAADEPEDKGGQDQEVVPDWLARIRERKSIEDANQPEKTGDTDWLSGLRDVSLAEEELEDEEVLTSEGDVFPEDTIETIDELLKPFPSEESLKQDLPEEKPLDDQDSIDSVEDLISELDMLSLGEAEEEVSEDLSKEEPLELEDSVSSIDDLIAELDELSSDDSEAKPERDLPSDLDALSLEEEDELLLEDLFAELDKPSEEPEKAIFKDELFADLDADEDKQEEKIIPDDLFADFIISPPEEEEGFPVRETDRAPAEDIKDEEETLLSEDFFADLGLEVAPTIQKSADEQPAFDQPEISDEALPMEETSLGDEPPLEEEIQPADEIFLSDLFEDTSGFSEFAPGSDLLAKEPDLEDLSELSTDLSIEAPFEPVSPEKSSLGDILSDFSPSWLDEMDISEGEKFPHVPALILDEELPPIEGVDEEGELTGGEIPSWLQDLGKDVEEDLVDEEDDLPVLAKATLPPWLEAMRPLETFRAPLEIELEEEEEIVEAAGPLAGLKGVLLAEPVVAMPRTPIVSVGTLDISDRDYSQTEILQKIVEEEQREEEAILKKRISFPLIRWIAAAVLVLGVTMPTLLGFPQFKTPFELQFPRQPYELPITRDVIDNTPLDQPVLLVFDYAPSYFAEMDAIAGALVENLFSRDQSVISLSTQPTGPMLADRMFKRVGVVHDAVNGEDYLHLGYLSGGTTAIQLFATAPSASLSNGFNLPDDFEGNSVWESPLLENIEQIQDFAMVAVITSGTEHARNWAEQIHPLMGETPLIMVVSAGAEPLIHPYFESEDPQIKGILTGLPSALIYEGYNGIQADAFQRWSSYGAGLLIAVAVIFAGAVYGVVTWVFKVKKTRDS
jgi:hypothetical protein